MVWFFEYIKPTTLEIGTGGIPRYRNWRFNETFYRAQFRGLLDALPIGIFKGDPLSPTPTEQIIYNQGFRASKYVSLVNQQRSIDTVSNMYLVDLLIRVGGSDIKQVDIPRV